MKNKLFALLAAAVISATAFSAPVQQLIGADITAEAAVTVKTPTANKKSGTYMVTGSMKIILSCATEDALIYYSTNGGETYKRYTKPFYISKNTSIKFYAKKDGVLSKATTRTYKLAPKFTITPNAGTYNGTQTVKLSSKVSGVKFYYTLDGSKPTTKSTLYTAKGITIDKTCKLRILTYKSGWTSRYVTKNYTIPTVKDEEVSFSSQSILENYKSKYAYSTLGDTQKKLYQAIYNGVSSHTAKIDLSEYNCGVADLETAFYAMDYDNPQFFWLNSGFSYSHSGGRILSVSPLYSRTKAETAKIQPKLEAAAEEITDLALLYDNLFDRVLYIHDAIIDATTYTTSGGECKRDADGPLLNGYALCEGYSKAFAYLCQSIGIEVVCIAGYSNEPHMWNMIKLDGQWYHMDVTFDDPVSTTPTCSYDYFCITTKEIQKTHTINNVFDIPSATATKYSYYNASGITKYTNATQAFTELAETAADNFSKGVYLTEIVCDDSIIKSVYNKINGSIFLELSKYGCSPAGAKFGYNGSTIYLMLNK